MSVIVDLRMPPTAFELGRILDVSGCTRVELEEMVPLGESAVPFFSVHDEPRSDFEAEVSSHSSVEFARQISTDNGETLYALNWSVGDDQFFECLVDTDAQMLTGRGTSEHWMFELRFPTHEALGAFQEGCESADIPLEIDRIYNPTNPEAGPWYGLTRPQRETLVRAVRAGYYSIPREISTQQLAEEFDISDQAVTERLRRAITTLVEHTLAEEDSVPAE